MATYTDEFMYMNSLNKGYAQIHKKRLTKTYFQYVVTVQGTNKYSLCNLKVLEDDYRPVNLKFDQVLFQKHTL